MPCYHPLKGFKGRNGGISWSPHEAYVDLEMEVPCGQCLGCRLERSRQWAVRIMHEASLYDSNCFVTLTYDDEHLPVRGSLNKADFVGFIKRLRSRVGHRIPYFHCGEYGSDRFRPHYHAILFDVAFADRRVHMRSKAGNITYTSALLSACWGKGLCNFGAVTFDSAGYVARYCLKKVTGDLAARHYERLDPVTGELYHLEPEYATMSNRPAIGQRWFEKYGKEVGIYDGVVSRGKLQRAPRYYDKLRERLNGRAGMRKVKRERVFEALEHASDNTEERLKVKEEVKFAAVSLLRRS